MSDETAGPEIPPPDDVSAWPVVRLLEAPPHNGYQSAAIGEALLRLVEEPVIAVIPDLLPPTVSIGYFQSWKEVPPEVPFVRRLTAGGLVDAVEGCTFSTFVPARHPRYPHSTGRLQQTFNDAVAKGLRRLGYEVEMTFSSPVYDPEAQPNCFEALSRFDLVIDGVKTASSSTYHDTAGLMQEIAIHLAGMDKSAVAESVLEDLLPLFGRTLEPSRLRSSERLLAEHLIATRYSTVAWNRCR